LSSNGEKLLQENGFLLIFCSTFMQRDNQGGIMLTPSSSRAGCQLLGRWQNHEFTPYSRRRWYLMGGVFLLFLAIFCAPTVSIAQDYAPPSLAGAEISALESPDENQTWILTQTTFSQIGGEGAASNVPYEYTKTSANTASMRLWIDRNHDGETDDLKLIDLVFTSTMAGRWSYNIVNPFNPSMIFYSGSGTFGILKLPTRPSITVAPKSQSVVVGAKVVLSVQATGSQPLTYEWFFNGDVLPGATNTTLTLTNVQLAATGDYAVRVSNSLGNETSPSATLTILPETVKPTLAITAPANKATLTNSPVLLAGNAADNVGVARVLYQVNNGAWETASGGSNWSATVTLAPGTNTVRAYAVDLYGNGSITNSITCVYVVTAPLVVQTNGSGTVNPNYSGQSLEIGRNYTMTAKPAAGWAFAYWSGSFSSTNPVLSFRMAYDLDLTATFVDIQRPSLQIAAPRAAQRMSNAVINALGTASDNGQVRFVRYQLNAGLWENAAGTTNWSASLTLSPGTNTLEAFSEDAYGNCSVTNRISFSYVLTAPLRVQTNGLGSITPNYNGVQLEIGRDYTLTATPASGWVFTQWSGSLTGASPALTFRMASNTVLVANFRDAKLPTLTVTQPLSNTRSSNALYTARGTALDNDKVAQVLYQLNGGGWQTAQGTTNWQANLTLMTGTNKLQVYAEDATGNRSPTNTISWVCLAVSIGHAPIPFSDARKLPSDLGYQRKEYFNNQQVNLSFIITNGQARTFNAWIIMANRWSGIPVASNSYQVTWPAGVSSQDLKWSITNSTPPGYYVYKAEVRDPGTAGLLADTELLDSAQALHVCQGNPVILIHGIKGSLSSFGSMETLLKESNDLATVSFDYSNLTHKADQKATIENIAAAFSGVDSEIKGDNGPLEDSRIWTNSIKYTTQFFSMPRVDVVAHSMGGLVARAYMAAMAKDGTNELGYHGEIDRLITLGSPFYGFEWFAELGQWAGYPRIQLAQMALGNRFLWLLNARSSVYEKHLAIAAYPTADADAILGLSADAAFDEVVPVLSAGAPTLAGQSVFIKDYVHTTMAKVSIAEASKHDGYQLVRAYLVGTEQAEHLPGHAFAEIRFDRCPVMIRTLGSHGDIVSCFIQGYGGLAEVDHGWGIHAAADVIPGNRTFKVKPYGASAWAYAPNDYTVDLSAGRLSLLTFSLSSTSDTEDSPDGLPDSYEQYYFGNAHSSQTGNGDADGDGMSNEAEMLMGFNPVDKSEWLKIYADSVTPSNDGSLKNIAVKLLTLPGFIYQLQARVSLSAPWQDIGVSKPGTGAEEVLFDQSSDQERYYRIKVTLSQ
jgi:pimeloyl-ACP methyl ester carboxylesterase